MRYLIDAWLDEGDPRLQITDADSGAVRLQWSYHRTHPCSGMEQGCSEDPPCPGCSALHCLVNHLFLLACADKLSTTGEAVPVIASNENNYSEPDMQATRQIGAPARRPNGN